MVNDELVNLLSDTKENKEKILTFLKGNIKSSVESEQNFAHFLDLLSKTKNYSYRNRMLISMQYDGASMVKSFNEWKKLGYAVRRGAKALKIVVPNKVEVYQVFENGSEIWKSKGKLTEQQKQKIDTMQHKSMTYYIVKPLVFDVSQTDFPIDENPFLKVTKLMQDESVQGQLETFTEFVRGRGISVSFVDINAVKGTLKGFYSPTNNSIVVSSIINEKAALKTLIHEYAHAYLDHGKVLGKMSANYMEVQAESIAYITMKRLGLSTEDYSFMYLDHYSSIDFKELEESIDIILKSSDTIYEDFSKYLGITIEIENSVQEDVPMNEVMKDVELNDMFKIDAELFEPNLSISTDLNSMKEIQSFFESNRSQEEFTKFLNERKMNANVVKAFGLGYAPNLASGSGFIASVDAQNQIKAGNYYLNDNGNVMPRFIERVTFPIRNVEGDIVGYGGRAIDGSKYAKYVNTSQTDLFTKGEHLYNLNNAKSSIQKMGYAIVTEGYMDTIAYHRAGVRNAVAVMGTSLTQEQMNLLRKFTDKVVISLDADLPGMEASRKLSKQLESNGFEVRSVLFAGSDPDEYLNQHGVKEFKDYFKNNRMTKLEYEFVYQMAVADFSSHEGCKKFVIDSLENGLHSERYQSALATMSGFSKETIQAQLGKMDIVAEVEKIPVGESLEITSFEYDHTSGRANINVKYGSLFLNDISCRNSKFNDEYFISEPAQKVGESKKWKPIYQINWNNEEMMQLKSKIHELMDKGENQENVKVTNLSKEISHSLYDYNNLDDSTTIAKLKYGAVKVNSMYVKNIIGASNEKLTYVNFPAQKRKDGKFSQKIGCSSQLKHKIVEEHTAKLLSTEVKIEKTLKKTHKAQLSFN